MSNLQISSTMKEKIIISLETKKNFYQSVRIILSERLSIVKKQVQKNLKRYNSFFNFLACDDIKKVLENNNFIQYIKKRSVCNND